MKQVIIGNHKKEVEYIEDGLFKVDGKDQKLDIEKLGENTFSVIRNHKNYMLQVLSVDRENKTITLKINNKTQVVSVKDHYDILVDSMGISNSSSKKIKELKAPMPGLVLEVLAKSDERIDKGSALFILEAMKMENIIKSPDEVVVDSVLVKAGDTVEKNQVLVTFA